MTDLKCEYHPDRDAVDKCERCNRLICLQDKQIIRNRYHHHSSTSSFDSYSYTQMIVCPLCYYDVSKEGEEMIGKVSSGMKIGGLIFGIFFIAVVIFMFNQFLSFSEDFTDAGGDSSFGIFFYVIFGFIFVFALIFIISAVKGPSMVQNTVSKQTDKAQQRKEQFLRSVENQGFVSSYGKDYQLTCYQCGSVIDGDALFCPSCGDPTDEERSDRPLK